MVLTSVNMMSTSSQPKNCLIFVRTKTLKHTRVNARLSVIQAMAFGAFPLFCFGGSLELSILQKFHSWPAFLIVLGQC